MKLPLHLLPLAAALLVALPAASQTASTASGQAYPVRPMRMIVPYAAGGNTDIVARALAARLSGVFGQQVLVDNRPGGATNIGSDLVARAPADGYTLLMAGAANAINMSLFAKPPYDTLRDFAPVILCVKGANVLSLHPSVPARSLKELIALAKARPGQLNFASAGIGSSNQMAGELLKMMAGINIVHVPYKQHPRVHRRRGRPRGDDLQRRHRADPAHALRPAARDRHRQPPALPGDSRGPDLR
jgi:tripartite-type tricarboxylate transporter receptor subunit TctC